MNSPVPRPQPLPPRLTTLAQLSRGTAWRLELQHIVDQDLFIWTTRGQGVAHLMGRRRGLGVHNALLVPAGSLLALDIGRQGFAQVVTMAPGSVPGLPREAQLLRIRDVQMQGELTSILDAMQREQNANRPLGDEAARAHAMLLSVWFRRAMTALLEPDARHSASDRLVTAFAALVARQFRTGKSMAAYAEALDVTPTHLTRVCKQTGGLTAADILTECTLHAARSELADSDRAIRDIAAGLGFASAAYFTRFIQHHTGRTPSALRVGKAA
ncbi:helix-turn-helix domain-containing protein [Pseudooceanicola sp. 216_PA32_1]|jgi:AraC family transcriptional regulator, transcriptional activator of pobA|uniref:Helix-turn-helix domain-containing protein n=1 Tax=Pseudooceanicola pacificus TaxID=2676438 RepID=A0A844VZT6_9RHOB|nr:helix-turn-helix domain-containing protein [Pseudooceanicola pacificus]MWB77316.1 helix-turn-helix domain-containing protein [Pseudooceanicola pacificus]